jgi:hypothetical protein
VSEWHEEPYDLFVWAKDEKEVTENLKGIYKNDYEDIDDTELADMIDNSSIYIVYGEEVK